MLAAADHLCVCDAVDVQGMLVKAATSYTSYRELWDEALQLSQVTQGGKGSEVMGG